MRKIFPLLLFLFFLYLLFFPRAAAQSAGDGLLLWYRSVLPVLFPFLFLGRLWLLSISPEDLPDKLTRPVRTLFGCSFYGTFVILFGFLCGFPMGARLTADLCEKKKISRKEARFLLGFANNLSPGFLISYVASAQMQLPGHAGLFVLPVLGPAFLFGILTRRPGRGIPEEEPALPQKTEGERLSFSLIDSCLFEAMNSALRLCAYIVLFSVLSGAASQIIPLSNPIALAMISSLEVTNGVRLLCESALPFRAKYVAVSALSAFGGFSALAQSAGMARMDRDLLVFYIKSRVKITLLSILFSTAAAFFL